MGAPFFATRVRMLSSVCSGENQSSYVRGGLLSRAGARRSHPMGRTFLPSLFRRPESLRHVRFIYKIHFLTLFPIRAIRVISDPKLFRLCLEKMRSAQKKRSKERSSTLADCRLFPVTVATGGSETNKILEPSLFQGHAGTNSSHKLPFSNHWVRETCLFPRTTQGCIPFLDFGFEASAFPGKMRLKKGSIVDFFRMGFAKCPGLK